MFKKSIVALVAAFIAIIVTPVAVFAASGDPVVTTDSNSLAQVKLSPFFVTSVIALFIPLVNGILTKLTTSDTAKALLTIVLTAINTFLTGLIMVGGEYVFSKESFITWIMTTVIAVASYLGVFKPTGLTSSAQILPDMENPGQTIRVPGKLSGVGRS